MSRASSRLMLEQHHVFEPVHRPEMRRPRVELALGDDLHQLGSGPCRISRSTMRRAEFADDELGVREQHRLLVERQFFRLDRGKAERLRAPRSSPFCCGCFGRRGRRGRPGAGAAARPPAHASRCSARMKAKTSLVCGCALIEAAPECRLLVIACSRNTGSGLISRISPGGTSSRAISARCHGLSVQVSIGMPILAPRWIRGTTSSR